MIRVPATLVGLVCAYALAAAAFSAARLLANERLLVVMLPMISWLASFTAGRLSERPAPVPGLAIGLLALAGRAGLGIGIYDQIVFYIEPSIALLELIAAVSGGMVGTLLARRAAGGIAPKAASAPFPS